MVGALLFASCVSKKLFRQSQMETAALRADSIRLSTNIGSLENNSEPTLENNITELNRKISSLSNQNSQLGQQTAEQQNQLGQSQQELQRQ